MSEFKVHLISHDQELHLDLAGMLTEIDCELSTSSDYLEGVLAVEKSEPDIVVVYLGNMNEDVGLLVDSIRHREKVFSVPILVIVDTISRDEAKEALEIGVTGMVLRKQDNDEAIIDKIMTLLDSSSRSKTKLY